MLSIESEEELDLGRALWDLGVDSLVGIEIRNWWRQTFGLDISVLETLNVKSSRELENMVVKDFKQKSGGRNKSSKQSWWRLVWALFGERMEVENVFEG